MHKIIKVTPFNEEGMYYKWNPCHSGGKNYNNENGAK